MPAPATVERTGQKTLVMGVLNCTPDSFYDGGELDGRNARDVALGMIADGADIIDIGGESSRPGAATVHPEEEWARLFPVLGSLQPLAVPISVDTYHASTAQQALALGAAMINDITALRGDPEMAGILADAGCGCVLMHMQGTPRDMQANPKYNDVVDDIMAFFEERLNAAVNAGIREAGIWLDPGFGFGKTVDDNLTILRRLREFTRLGRPVLIGTSNKSTIGAVLGTPVHDRMEGTAATVALAIANGADAVRVHDVKTMARVASMTDAIVGRGNEKLSQKHDQDVNTQESYPGHG